MKLQVYVSAQVDDDLVAIARYYRHELKLAEAGRRLVDKIYAAMERLADVPYRRRTADDLPAEYRRYLVDHYIIFYRINTNARRLTAYHVRYAGRKPLVPSTHRRRAALAERDSHPLHPRQPDDN